MDRQPRFGPRRRPNEICIFSHETRFLKSKSATRSNSAPSATASGSGRPAPPRRGRWPGRPRAQRVPCDPPAVRSGENGRVQRGEHRRVSSKDGDLLVAHQLARIQMVTLIARFSLPAPEEDVAKMKERLPQTVWPAGGGARDAGLPCCSRVAHRSGGERVPSQRFVNRRAGALVLREECGAAGPANGGHCGVARAPCWRTQRSRASRAH